MRFVFDHEFGQIESGTKIVVFGNDHEPHTFFALEENDTVESAIDYATENFNVRREDFVTVLEK